MRISGVGLRSGCALAALAISVVATAPPVHAQVRAGEQRYDLPNQDLGTSLRAVARISGRNVIAAAELVSGKTASALRGRFTAEQAAARLLAGSGLHIRMVGTDLVVELDGNAGRQSSVTEPEDGAEIVVTGSRIRGAPIASRSLH